MIKLKMLVVGCCIAAGVTLQSAPASAALLSYWDFEGNFNDIVGSNHATKVVYTGTFTGVGANDATTAAVAGRSGQSLVLDGNGDGLQTPANSTLDFGDGASFTLSFWYKAVQNTLDNNTAAVGDGRSTFIMRDSAANPFNGYSVLADTINSGETGGAATTQNFRTSLDGGKTWMVSYWMRQRMLRLGISMTPGTMSRLWSATSDRQPELRSSISMGT